MEGKEFNLSSTGAVYWDTNGKPLFISQMVKKKGCHNSQIHTHTKVKKITIVDLPTSKICETEKRYIQMIFDKYAIQK